MFRASSLEMVEGAWFNRAAIARTPRPSGGSTPIRSRSNRDRYRPDRVSWAESSPPARHGADPVTDQLPRLILEGKASLASWSSHVHPFIQAGCCVES